MEDFTQAHLLRKSKSAGGLKTARKTERAERPTKRPYLFRGIVRCTACGRKMEASPRARGVYYRCPARTLAPGSPALATHPPTVYLREDVLQEAVNGWLGRLFAPENRDRTVAALVESQGTNGAANGREAAKARLAKAEAQLSRFQEAIKAGIDPLALVEPMNEAQAVRAAARAELEGTPAPDALSAAEVHAMIDSLGNVGAALADAEIESVASLYRAVDLQVRYTHTAHEADVIIKPVGHVNSARVREVCPNTRLWGIPHSPRRGVAHKTSLAALRTSGARVGNSPLGLSFNEIIWVNMVTAGVG